MKHVLFSISWLLLFLATAWWTGCRPSNAPAVEVQALTAKTDSAYRAVIEIPAGTNVKIEYDKENNLFAPDQLADGSDRLISFLPYPANYGYIPGTLMNQADGGDGDALDVIVLAASLPTGTVVEIQPLATMLLRDNDELDYKVIAVPVDSNLQLFPVGSYTQLAVEHNAVLNLLKDWFLNYKGPGQMEFDGWRNDQFTRHEIDRWIVGE